MITFTNTIRVLNEYGDKIRNLYRSKNLQAGYDPSSELQNITYTVDSGAGNFSITFNMPDYWIYAEKGRGPGKMPPKGSLMKWMQFKQILPQPMQLKSGRTVLPSMESLEFLIRRKIGREGTEGSHTWEATENEIKQSLIDDIKDALEKDFRKYMEDVLKNRK